MFYSDKYLDNVIFYMSQTKKKKKKKLKKKKEKNLLGEIAYNVLLPIKL